METATRYATVTRMDTLCSACGAKSVCLPADVDGHALRQLDRIIGSPGQVCKGEHLLFQGDSFHCLYAIQSGCLKTATVTDSGGEHIIGFHLPGEIIGLDAISRDIHASDAVALTDATICPLPFAQLGKLTREWPELQARLLELISEEITIRKAFARNLSAQSRLAAFLLHWSGRLQRRNLPARRFVLPVYRSEIGNYLRLTTETVSRCFTGFVRDGTIHTDGQTITLSDYDRLAGYCPPDMLDLIGITR